MTFEKCHKVGFCSLLKCLNGRGRKLERRSGILVIGDLSDDPLEGQLGDEGPVVLLIMTDFHQGATWNICQCTV